MILGEYNLHVSITGDYCLNKVNVIHRRSLFLFADGDLFSHLQLYSDCLS